jgi:hypothetical protein
MGGFCVSADSKGFSDHQANVGGGGTGGTIEGKMGGGGEWGF